MSFDLSAFRPNGARQWPLSDFVRLTYADFTEANTSAAPLVFGHIPAAGMLVHGYVGVITPYAGGSGTTATLDIGDAEDPDRYTAAPLNVMAAAGTATVLTIPAFVTASPTDLIATFAGSLAGLTAGEIVIYYTAVAEGRKNEQILAR